MTTGNFYEELIKGDWLGRDPEEYTYSKGGTSIGWEKSLVVGEAYSTFILPVSAGTGSLKYPKQIMLAKQACTNIMNRMLVKSSTKTRITFTTDFNSYAQGSLICVTLEPLKKDNEIKFPSFNHALDPILGYCAHEIGHILYTDESYGIYLNQFKGAEQNLKAMIMNILEDERIEKLIAQNYRGYTHYVGKAKEYCFGKKFQHELEKLKADTTAEKKEDLNRLVEVFIHLIRYPRALQEADVNDFESEITQFQDLLTPYPENIQELSECTEEIYKVFLSYFKQQAEPEEEEEQTEQEREAKAQQGGGNIKSNKGEDQEKPKSKPKKGGLDNLSPKELEKLATELAKGVEDMLEALAKSGMFIGTADEIAEEIFEGSYSISGMLSAVSDFKNEDLQIRKSETHSYPALKNLNGQEMSVIYLESNNRKATTNHYDRALAEVRSYAGSLRAELQKLNRNTEVTNTGLFEGSFDDGLLVDALIGAKNVYNETFKVKNRGACVVVCSDESGSMEYNNAWFKAMQIAVMFERALDGVNNVDFFCYGHTTGYDEPVNSSDSTVINTYFEGRKKGKRQDLGKMYHHNANRDGHAITEIVSRVRTRIDKDLPIIMFMISDGAPSASVPAGYSQKEYTKKCVDMVEKNLNATIIHVAITAGIPSSDMFNNYVTFTDFKTLVKDVGGLLKKIIVDRQQPITI